MTKDLTAETHPFLADLAYIAGIRSATKNSIIDIDARIAQIQDPVNSGRMAPGLQGSSRSSLRSHALRNVADLMARNELSKQLLEAHLQTIDSLYIKIESDLKAKILEVSGGDQSLLAALVPKRPAGITPI
jgi:hypothetical protein